MMSGGFLYPPTLPDSNIGILFIKTSGCPPMCGHGTIGVVTFGPEHGLIQPATPGKLTVEVPAGVIDITYETASDKVTSVKIINVPACVAARGITVDIKGIGPLAIDVAYGATSTRSSSRRGFLGASRIVDHSGRVREAVRAVSEQVHPSDPTIRGVSHILWADQPRSNDVDGRNAVFYGNGAIDRSPCRTGTSARLAHLAASGRLTVGENFVHESYLDSRFVGRIEAETMIGDQNAIISSIEASAISTGLNTIWIDKVDHFWEGFQVK